MALHAGAGIAGLPAGVAGGRNIPSGLEAEDGRVRERVHHLQTAAVSPSRCSVLPWPRGEGEGGGRRRKEAEGGSRAGGAGDGRPFSFQFLSKFSSVLFSLALALLSIYSFFFFFENAITKKPTSPRVRAGLASRHHNDCKQMAMASLLASSRAHESS